MVASIDIREDRPKFGAEGEFGGNEGIQEGETSSFSLLESSLREGPSRHRTFWNWVLRL